MKVSLFIARAEMCFIRSYYQQTRRIVREKNVFTRQNRLSNDLPEFFSLGMEEYQNFFKANLS